MNEPSQPMNLQETIENVRAWGIAKGITGPNGKGTLLGQLSKTAEELTETRDAAVAAAISQHAMGSHATAIWNQSQADLIDGLGDVFVAIILAAEMAGLRIEDCLSVAYDEIKGRTGKMVGGIFVKDQP